MENRNQGTVLYNGLGGLRGVMADALYQFSYMYNRSTKERMGGRSAIIIDAYVFARLDSRLPCRVGQARRGVQGHLALYLGDVVERDAANCLVEGIGVADPDRRDIYIQGNRELSHVYDYDGLVQTRDIEIATSVRT